MRGSLVDLEEVALVVALLWLAYLLAVLMILLDVLLMAAALVVTALLVLIVLELAAWIARLVGRRPDVRTAKR